jgi:hypothetical protein
MYIYLHNFLSKYYINYTSFDKALINSSPDIRKYVI